MFTDPSIAQKIADLVRQIATDTQHIRDNTGRINRASVNLARTWSNIANSTNQTANNLNAVVNHLRNTNAQAVNTAAHFRNIANNAASVNTNTGATNKKLLSMKNVVTAIGAAWGYVTALMARLQNQGLALAQSWNITVQSVKNLGQILRTGVIASVNDLSMATVGLGRQLGNIKNISNALVESTVELSNVYNVSEQAAAKINAQLFRWSQRDAERVRYAQQYVVALAKTNGIIPADLIEQMAQHTNDLARYANQGAEGFGKQLITLQKMGVSMQSINGLADRLVMDFEGSLTAAARLQTFLPGFDISGMQFAAQFGTPEQVATEVQSALQRSGIGSLDRLPRSLQNMLGSALGMSMTEMQNMLTNTQGQVEVRAPTKADFDSGIDKLLNSGLEVINKTLEFLRNDANKILAYLIGRDAGGVISRNFRRGRALVRMRQLGRAVTGGGSLMGRIGVAGGIIAPVAGAINQYATGGGLGGVLGSLGGGAIGGILGTIVGGPLGFGIGSTIGSLIGPKIAMLFRKPEDVAKRAAEAQAENTKAVAQSTKTIQDSALKQAAATAGVKDFNFAFQQYQQNIGGVGAGASAIGNGSSPGFFSKLFSSFGRLFSFPKFHSGGVVGDEIGRGDTLSSIRNLRPEETIAILKRGEVVLTSEQMNSMGRMLGNAFRINLSGIVGSFTNAFDTGTSKIVSYVQSTLSSGFLGKITGMLGGTSSITSKISGFMGNLGESAKGLLGGKLSGLMSNVGGGILGKISGIAGGNLGDLLGGALSGGTGGLLTKAAGLLTGGGLKTLGTNLISKIGGSIIGKLGGAKIGAALGSIIPGAGTIVGGLVGAGFSKLANSAIGKTIGGLVSKFTPIGIMGKKIGGAVKSIGKKLGGLFGKKKKAKVTAPTPMLPTDLGTLLSVMTPGINGSALPASIMSLIAGDGTSLGNLSSSITSTQQKPIAVDTTILEGKLDQLISLMKSGGITINLDGRKVSSGLMEANRYG